jgi:hypothetical protein
LGWNSPISETDWLKSCPPCRKARDALPKIMRILYQRLLEQFASTLCREATAVPRTHVTLYHCCIRYLQSALENNNIRLVRLDRQMRPSASTIVHIISTVNSPVHLYVDIIPRT